MKNHPTHPSTKEGWRRPDERRGRGSVTAATGRYEAEVRIPVNDGWENPDEIPPLLHTTLHEDISRTIIARNSSPDIPFDRSINPYRGCEHGCIYCFARPTHAWLGLSPGLDFESRIFFKPRAAELLEAEFRKPRYTPRPIAMGTNTDPYQPAERKLEIMRGILRVLNDFGHPFSIVTKSHLVTRDIDLIAPMAARGLVHVALSVTTLNHRLARRMEPRASSPRRRLAAIQQLTEAGIPTAVMVAPVIPGLTDHELEKILTTAREAGASRAGYIMLRLPIEVKVLFREWLAEVEPLRAKRVMDHVQGMRGGQDYQSTWGTRMRGQGPYADLIADRFKKAIRRLNFNLAQISGDISQFQVPPRERDQLSLL